MPESTSVMVWAKITAAGRSPIIFVSSGVKLNSQRNILDILEAELLPWARQQLIVHIGLFNKTLVHHMAPKWIQAGFRPTFQHWLAKMNGPQGAQIWTLSIFLCGQFWRVRFAELLMIHWINWSWSCYKNGHWSLKKYCVPPVKLTRVDWSLSLKIK